MRLALLLTIPSAVGLAVLRVPIIALIYERGGFTTLDTQHTADVLAFYAIGLAGYSVIKILAPAFYALGDARAPMIFSVLSMVLNFLMNWSLVGVIQERGLAFSTSMSALLNSSMLYFTLQHRIQGLEGRRTAITLIKILISSAVMSLACWAVTNGISDHFGKSFVARVINIFVSVAVGASVFYTVAYLLGIQELKSAVAAVKRKFVRRSNN
jgi:putative peptidoglycan lipid II flippase